MRLSTIALRCADLVPGVYRYGPDTRGFELQVAGDRVGKLQRTSGRAWNGRTRAVIAVTTNASRATAVHGIRGHRYAVLEAGHLAQNLLLFATAAGLPAGPVAGFADDLLGDLVGCGDEEFALDAVVL